MKLSQVLLKKLKQQLNAEIMNNKTNNLWGGRFSESTDDFVKVFGASILFDKILAPYDIQGSIAHATMLCEVGIIAIDEKEKIINGLNQIPR